MTTDLARLHQAAAAENVLQPRRFAVAWRNSSSPSISPIGILKYAESLYRFSYLASAESIPEFRPLVGFPDLHRVYAAASLFPFFAQRVMDWRRPDFASYLTALGLAETASDLDVLGRSGGRRKGDTIHVMEQPSIELSGATSCDFLVQGIRHSPAGSEATSAALAELVAEDALRLLPEPGNPVNPKAMLVVTADGVAIGWVPDLLLEYVSAMLQAGPPSLTVRRANGRDMPWHLRVVARLSGVAPKGYLPFSGPAWQTASLEA